MQGWATHCGHLSGMHAGVLCVACMLRRPLPQERPPHVQCSSIGARMPGPACACPCLQQRYRSCFAEEVDSTWPMTKENMRLTSVVMLCPALRVSSGCTSEEYSQPRGPQDQAYALM